MQTILTILILPHSSGQVEIEFPSIARLWSTKFTSPSGKTIVKKISNLKG